MNSDVVIAGKFFIWSAFGGLLGAGAMVMVLWAFTKTGLAKVRLVVAVGSLFTRSYERAVPVGCFVHVATGIFFGQIYGLVLMAIHSPNVGVNIAWGIGLGWFHGLMMALVLIGAIADAHPLEEFQQRSWAIAISHCVAHMMFGLVVGLVIGLSGLTQLTN